MACLVIVEGPATGVHFALAAHKLVDVGRDEECTFQIVDPLVSRHHLQVRAANDGAHVLLDSGSANSVMVNAVRIVAETVLKDGDEIKVGSTKIIYTTTDYPDAKSAIVGVRPGRQWTARTMKHG
jgi:pSer/pThr/pTyr-binding forkhead associated (FHA) protein